MRLDYDQFEADRDAMADEFIEVHQECVSKLADCHSRMADFDNALLALSLGRPANVSVNLSGPELRARNLADFVGTASILGKMRLFDLSSRQVWAGTSAEY